MSILSNLFAGPDARERRSAIRYACERPTVFRPFIDADETLWSARIGDISLSGIKLLAERRFESGTILNIETEAESKDDSPRMIARVVHVRRRATGGWVLGCRFAKELGSRELVTILQAT